MLHSELSSRQAQLVGLTRTLRAERRQSARLRVELRREARQRYAWQQWARVFDRRRYQRLIAAAKRRGEGSTQP